MPLASALESPLPGHVASSRAAGRRGAEAETPRHEGVSPAHTEGWCDVSQERPEERCSRTPRHGLKEILASGTLRVLVVLPSRQLIDWFLMQIVTGVLAGTPFVRIMEVNHRTTPPSPSSLRASPCVPREVLRTGGGSRQRGVP